MCDPSELPRFVYATTTHADDIARYGRLVIEAAQAGDRIANAIMNDAGTELGSCVLAVARKLGLIGTDFPVAYVGGAFHAGELLLNPMMRVIRAEAPKTRIGPPAHAPVEGAALMAIRASVFPRPTRAPS